MHAPTHVQVHLARSGRTLALERGQPLMLVLLTAGVRARAACRSGTCGACELRVLAGLPWHRDPVYAARAVPPADRVRPCVSSVASAELTLDL